MLPVCWSSPVQTKPPRVEVPEGPSTSGLWRSGALKSLCRSWSGANRTSTNNPAEGSAQCRVEQHSTESLAQLQEILKPCKMARPARRRLPHLAPGPTDASGDPTPKQTLLPGAETGRFINRAWCSHLARAG